MAEQPRPHTGGDPRGINHKEQAITANPGGQHPLESRKSPWDDTIRPSSFGLRPNSIKHV